MWAVLRIGLYSNMGMAGMQMTRNDLSTSKDGCKSIHNINVNEFRFNLFVLIQG
jgi:hypothetical protein